MPGPRPQAPGHSTRSTSTSGPSAADATSWPRNPATFDPSSRRGNARAREIATTTLATFKSSCTRRTDRFCGTQPAVPLRVSAAQGVGVVKCGAVFLQDPMGRPARPSQSPRRVGTFGGASSASVGACRSSRDCTSAQRIAGTRLYGLAREVEAHHTTNQPHAPPHAQPESRRRRSAEVPTRMRRIPCARA